MCYQVFYLHESLKEFNIQLIWFLTVEIERSEIGSWLRFSNILSTRAIGISNHIYISGVFRAARVQAVEGNASIQKSGRPRLASSTRRNSLWKNRWLVMVPWQRSVDAYVADGYCVSLDFGNDPVILGRIYFECSQISYTRTIEFRFSTL